MNIIKNILLPDTFGRQLATDIFFEATGHPKPVCIYIHGFNGFKDWGNFDLIARQFAAAGFVLIKFNFSFNGTTPGQPEEFTDLAAYAENNYTRELANTGTVIDWVTAADHPFADEMDTGDISLIGHSRGGGIALLKAAADDRIRKVITWASVSECKTPWGSWPQERMDKWQETGIDYTMNSRTRQQLPLHYQLYQDYSDNRDSLDIAAAIKKLQIPVLICHGSEDTSVPVEKAYTLQQWQPAAVLFIVPSDHVFGRRHPWPGRQLPEAMQQVVSETILFCRRNGNINPAATPAPAAAS